MNLVEPGPAVSPSTCPRGSSEVSKEYLVPIWTLLQKPQQRQQDTIYVSWYIYMYMYMYICIYLKWSVTLAVVFYRIILV